jgi:2-isopropylmalate synthase
VAALARATPDDINAAWEAVRDSAHPRIHVFLATSPIHMEHKLRMSPEEVVREAAASIALARDLCADVEFSPEDATRSDPDFLVSVCQAAVEAGASTVNIPDTVGYATPADYGALIGKVVAEVGAGRDRPVVSAHCHDDLGLAVANSLAAVENGARQVEGTINGLGERAGNAALEEVVMALVIRAEIYGVSLEIDTRELLATSSLVAEMTGYPIQYNKAIVGRNAFAHESGIHQHAVLRERTTYEIINPLAVGHAGSEIVIGKHSGRAALEHVLRRLQIHLDPEAFEQVFRRIKATADRTGPMTADALLACVMEGVA